MKRFAGLFFVISTLLPAGALAETVGVRSGEHAGFTRVVIDFAAQEDWVFGRVEDGFEFRPARENLSYRLDRVFDKIGRNRIEDVRDLGDGRLLLGVSCDCHAIVDELSNGKVVLDIVAGSAPAPGTGPDAELPPFGAASGDLLAADGTTPVEPPVTIEPSSAHGFVSDRAGLPLTFPRVGPFALDTMSAPRPVPAAPAAPVDFAASETAPDTVAEEHPEPQAVASGLESGDARAARIAQTEAALLEQVARAAAQGLLDADISDLEKNVADSGPEPVDVPSPAEFTPPSPPVAQRGHISVETSVDRAVAGNARQVRETDDGEACIDPAFFDIGNWGAEIGSGADIGAYRSRLITELDDTDSTGVSELVRNYVYITFGAEAKALLSRYPDSVERPDLLFAMAEIMDEGRSSRAAELADQMTCEGATALWATLAQGELRPGQPLNRDAISMAFAGLPAHLRRHLGPKLAEALLSSGDRETADLIRAAIDRVNDSPTSEYSMLAAQFELDAGEVDQATETLDGVVAAGDAVLPEALLQRVEATLAAGGAVAEDVVVLLDSLAFQYRGTDTARQMLDAGIRARASVADFTGAFEQLGTAVEAGLFSAERSAALREGLYDRVARDTNDTQFLRLSMPRLEEISGLSAEPRRAVARRLLALGFSGPARAALGGGSAIPDSADRLLLARAALVEQRPAVAIGYLAGLNEPAALSLRAQALDRAQDHAGAMRAYEVAGDPDNMVRMAWRGGLWADVAQLDQGALGTAAQLMVDEQKRGQQTLPSDGQPALADAQALITESEAARQALSALLDVVTSPADDPAPAGLPAF